MPSRKPEVSAGHWNDVFSAASDRTRLRLPRRETVVMLEVAKDSGGGIYLTIEEVEPHREEPVEIVSNDEVFYEAVDLMIPTRPDSGVDMRQGPSGSRPRPDDEEKDERK